MEGSLFKDGLAWFDVPHVMSHRRDAGVFSGTDERIGYELVTPFPHGTPNCEKGSCNERYCYALSAIKYVAKMKVHQLAAGAQTESP